MVTNFRSLRATTLLVLAATLANLLVGTPADAKKDGSPQIRGRLRFDQPIYGAPGCALLTLHSTDLNTDPTKAQTVEVETRSRDAGDVESLLLVEDGANTGRFTLPTDTCLGLAAADAAPQDQTLQVEPGDGIAAVALSAGLPVAADIAAMRGSSGAGDFVSSVDGTLLPKGMASVPSGIPGEPDMPLAMVVGEGVPAFFGADQLIVPVEHDDDLFDLLARRGGRLVGTVALDQDASKPRYHVVRFEPDVLAQVDTEEFDARMNQVGVKGTYVYSSETARAVMTIALEEQLGGLIAQPHALAQNQAAPADAEGWFGNQWFDGDAVRGRVRAREALTMMAITEQTTPVKLAVIDSGFAGTNDFSPAGDPGTYGRPWNSVEGCDVNAVGIPSCGPGQAGGPGALPCSGTGACPWHGYQMWSVAGAPLNDGNPGAGTGANIATPMLYKIGMPFLLPLASSIAHASLNGAKVISISSGFPCRALLLSVCNPFEAFLLGLVACTVLLAVPVLGALGCGAALALLATAPAFAAALDVSLGIAEVAGVVVTSAAGNAISIGGGPPSGPYDAGAVEFVPCARPTVVCVGWLDSGTDITHHTNSGFGSVVDVWVPGTNMANAPAPDGNAGSSGTSPATAFNAGVVAMVRSIVPGLNVGQVRDLIAASRCNPSQTARTGGGNCTPSGSARVNLGGGYIDVLEAFRRARVAAGRAHMAPCTGGWDETGAGDTAATATALAFTGTPPTATLSGDISIHAFPTDEDWFSFTLPGSSASSVSTRVRLTVPQVASGQLRMEIHWGTSPVRRLATVPVGADGSSTFQQALIPGVRYLVRIYADTPVTTHDNCYHSTLTVQQVGPGPASDRFEPNDSVSAELTGWEHTHHNPRAAESAEIWRMSVRDLTLHTQHDFDRFRFTLPNLDTAGHGPLLECGFAGNDSLGGTIEHQSQLTVRVRIRGEAGRTGPGATLFPTGHLGETQDLPALLRYNCPQTEDRREWRVFVDNRSYPFASIYDIEIEYRVQILRRLPSWVHELRALRGLEIGILGCQGGAFPACGPDPRGHPFNPGRISDCNPRCTDAFPFQWAQRAGLSMRFVARPGMTFEVFNFAQQRVGAAQRSLAATAAGEGETETLYLDMPDLEEGSYVLLVDGEPGEFSVSYDPPDSDGDGVVDAHDVCHGEPEDLDGVDDEDGCPDPPGTIVEAIATTGGENGWTTGNWTVKFGCPDCAKTEVEVNGKATAHPLTLTQEGSYKIRYRSTDTAGLVEEWKETLLGIDRTAPTSSMSIQDPTVFVTLVGGEFAASASDGGPAPSGIVGVCFQIDSVAGESQCLTASEGSGEWRASPQLAPGVYEVAARATDGAGNAFTSAPIRVVVV